MYEKLWDLVTSYKSQGKTLPCTAVNEDGEDVIISEGMNEGMHYFHLQTMQHNGHVRLNDYYSNGTSEEYFDDDPEHH